MACLWIGFAFWSTLPVSVPLLPALPVAWPLACVGGGTGLANGAERMAVWKWDAIEM